MDTDWFKSFHRLFLVSSRWRVLAMLLLLMSYLLFGSIVFAFLDQNYSPHKLLKSRMSSHALIRSMVTVLRENFSDDEIAGSFSKEHFDTYHDGKEILTSWYEAYEKSFMLAVLLIGCIGYGNAEPTQGWGVLILITYLFIGYPIQFIMIRLLGIQIRSFFRKILNWVKELKYRYLPESCHHLSFDLYTTIFLFFLAMGVVFVFGPSAIFERFENWSYTEGLYFSVMTLCAIGFGDYAAGVSSRATDAYLFYLYSVAIFVWIVCGIAYFDTYLELGSYTTGVFILDKLDGKRDRRKAAREDASNLYNLVADLNWKLTKYCPKEFTKQRVYQQFLDIYVDNPEEITEELMQELHQTLQELKAISGDKLLHLHASVEKSLTDDSEVDQSTIDRELKSQTERRRSARMTLTHRGTRQPPLGMLYPDNNRNENLSEIKYTSSSSSDRSIFETLLEKVEKDGRSREISSAEEEEKEVDSESMLSVDKNTSKERSESESALSSSSDRSTLESLLKKVEKEGKSKKIASAEAEEEEREAERDSMLLVDKNTSKERSESESALSSSSDRSTLESLLEKVEKGERSKKIASAEAEVGEKEVGRNSMLSMEKNTSKERSESESALLGSSEKSSPKTLLENQDTDEYVSESISKAEVEEEHKEGRRDDNRD